MPRNKRYNAYSVVTTHGKRPRVDYAFARQPRAIKNTTRTELRDETIVGVTWLIIKDKIVDAISSYKIRLNTRPFDADYRVKWRVLWYKMTQIILWNMRFNTMGVALSFTIQPLNTLLYLCILLITIWKTLCFSLNLLWFESMFQAQMARRWEAESLAQRNCYH